MEKYPALFHCAARTTPPLFPHHLWDLSQGLARRPTTAREHSSPAATTIHFFLSVYLLDFDK
jgi:hypothetical protein